MNKRYPEYKESGVASIGYVPKHWYIQKLKRCFYVNSGDFHDSGNERDDGFPIYGGNGLRGYSSTYNSEGKMLLIGRVGAKCGNIHLVDGQYWVSEHALKVNPKKEFILKYFYYLLENINLNEFAIQTAQPLINSTIVVDRYSAIPPINEQQQIANYLDHKTQKIDTLIEKKQRLLELLKEQRTAIINQAVTKGLDPNVPMKDSGVEWIGEIPEHWEIRRLKFPAKLINVKVENANNNLRYIGLENIESWTGILLESENQSDFEGQANLFKSGDVLFCKLRPYLAKAYKAFEDGVCTSELLVLRPKEVIQSYLFYFLINPNFIEVVNSSTYGAKMPRANWDFIGNLLLTVPKLEEQEQIVEYLDVQTQNIDETIRRENKKIELLKEYRQSLISDVVTGKIDVRDWNG
ncbi:restriction endonuclease subunit S [candidate division KSB1 bacterium]|nr:restriction endonuclease subunit S [candidate division KSB1 bacterium]